MSSSQQYIDITLVPTGQTSSRALWIHHILPLPLSAALAKKWDYIFQRFRVWYQDSDGDDITIGSSSEFVSAVNELLRERHFVRFQFRMGEFVDDELLFKLMDQLDHVKIRYRILGSESGKGSIEFDKETKRIKDVVPYRNLGERQSLEEEAKLAEEEIDPAIFNEPIPTATKDTTVKIGDNTKIGDNVKIGEGEGRMNDITTDSVPEHDDLIHTPEAWSPASSPRFVPFANNDTPLINLPCIPTYTPLPPPHTSHEEEEQEEQEETADDPPETAPSESSFPTFPGTFPTESNNPPNYPYGDFQTRISLIIQSTLDSLARLGHLSISAAQNTGFPVTNTNTFDDAHRRVDINTQFARNNLEWPRRARESKGGLNNQEENKV